MFQLYQSNKIEALLAQLVSLLLQQECSPLKSQIVVVENPGLAHWLKMQMAQSLGIAANIEFPMPSRFFWQIQRSVQPELDDESVFSKDTLTWLILECLSDSELLAQPSFALLKTYLENHDSSPQQQALKQYRLATTIADLYDQYLVFRPDWIEAWQKNDLTLDGKPLADQAWQGQLWITLIELAQQKGLCTHHRASMLQDFMQVLKTGENKQALPKEVIFFGFSTLPKHQIETLSLLSQHMDVHLLTPNPSMHYWGDVMDETLQAKLRMRNKPLELADAGNDLLASLGVMGKDFQRLLLDIEKIQEQPMFYESEDDSILALIQNQILNLQQGKDEKTKISSSDQSIQIVGCHSAIREIEVLHDHLLKLFSDSSLEPQEVVVMIPDVASYAPYIDAVFNSSKINIPYSISDRPVQAEHPLLAAFIALLDLPSGRLNFSDVMSLLEVPSVYRSYGIAELQLPKLKSWLIEAGIRWGFDAEHREKQGLPNWQQNTWLDGFQRLLMGYAVNSQQPVNGISPIQDVEGLEAALLGPLMQFVQQLHAFILKSEEILTAKHWSGYLHGVINEVFDISELEQPVIEHMYQAMESWAESIQRVSYQTPMPFSVLVDGLKQRLQQRSGSQHFMVGKVNFCTLLPMRSIPFKVVAVLGLNDQDYPRSVTPNSLDLMRFERRIGDRSRRDEDRYLFLEAILSARESLWLSYKSRDQKEDKPMTPSVVLAELLDYLTEGFEYEDGTAPLHELFTQHPLQPFNQNYYAVNSPLFSYNQDWLSVHEKNDGDVTESVTKNAVSAASLTSVKNTEFNEKEVLLEELISFYQNPSKFYLNNNLNINLSIWAEAQDNDEPFELDGLTLFQMKQKLLESTKNNLSQGSTQSAHTESNDLAISSGLLAYGEIGERQWQAVQLSIAPLLDQCQSYMVNAIEAPLEINLTLRSLFSEKQDHMLQVTAPAEISILGWVSNVYDENLIHVLPSKLKAKHVINILLEHSLLCAMGHQFTAKLICQDQILNIQPQSKAQAIEYIKPLLEYFVSAKSHPLALLPETAWQLMRPAKKGGKEFNHTKHSMEAFDGISGPFGLPGEKEDLHLIRCLGHLSETPQETIVVAGLLFDSWKESMEIIDHV